MYNDERTKEGVLMVPTTLCFPLYPFSSTAIIHVCFFVNGADPSGVYGLSLVGIAGSNSAGSMDVYLL
jgi:hypothetical protein